MFALTATLSPSYSDAREEWRFPPRGSLLINNFKRLYRETASSSNMQERVEGRQWRVESLILGYWGILMTHQHINTVVSLFSVSKNSPSIFDVKSGMHVPMYGQKRYASAWISESATIWLFRWWKLKERLRWRGTKMEGDGSEETVAPVNMWNVFMLTELSSKVTWEGTDDQSSV